MERGFRPQRATRAAGPAALALLLGCLGGCLPVRARTAGEIQAERQETRLTGKPQRHALSCEARAACDLLAAHGIPAAEDEFLRRLPRSDDPEEGFVGDVDGPVGRLPPESYGVHAPPIAATLRSFRLDARVERGRNLAWLKAEAAAGRPVVVWIPAGCRRVAPVECTSRRGTSFRAVPFEHAVLVIGERPGRVVWLDPASGEVQDADDAVFDAAWALFDRAAVSATGPVSRGDAPAPRTRR
jgi:uncharacterized protein YvpB